LKILRVRSSRAADFIDATEAPLPLKWYFQEIVMFFSMYFAFFLEHIGYWFELAERRRRDEYLAGARDLIDLERRIRSIEREGYPR
jgi:hypothetical protein